MMFDLKGRTAVVTGASAGLGTEIAEGLARQGADLAILARRGGLLEKQAEKLRAYGVRVMPVVCDVTKQQEVEQAADMIVKEYGKIDIAVNNAGGGKGAKAEEMPAENWEYTINLSLNGMYHCCKAFGKFMLNAAVVFLAAEESSYVNGAILPVDGGMTCI